MKQDRASAVLVDQPELAGQPFLTRATIVNLIAATRTKAALTVRCIFDKYPYPNAVTVTAAPMASIHLTPRTFHGDWNYTIHPTKKREFIFSRYSG